MVFSDPVDMLYEEDVRIGKRKREPSRRNTFPGQYDQRVDSISQCVQFLTILGERPRCRICAKLDCADGTITDEEFQRIKEYCVNPIECRIASMDKLGNTGR